MDEHHRWYWAELRSKGVGRPVERRGEAAERNPSAKAIVAAGSPHIHIQRLVTRAAGPQDGSGLGRAGPHGITGRRLVVIATLYGIAEAVTYSAKSRSASADQYVFWGGYIDEDRAIE